MKKCFCIAVLLLIHQLGMSQSNEKPLSKDSSIYFIRTIKGKEFIGKITEDNDSTFTVQLGNKSGASFVLIPKKEAKEIKIVRPEEVVNNRYWGTIPNISYVLSPSGYSLPKRQWYFQNIWIIYNQMNYGITNHLQLGLGGFVPDGMLWANARVTLPIVTNRLMIGGTVNYLMFSKSSFWINEPKYLIAYGFATIGSPLANLTIGYGRVYNKENNSMPLLVVSGAVRVSKSVLMVTENYIDERVSEQIHLVGMKTGRRIFSLTVGVSITKANRFSVLPWIGFGVLFGKK